MPLYEYQCEKCAHRFEVIQKFSDAPIEVCPKCGGAVKKLFSSPAIQFKGTGWYITDYAQKGKSGGESSSGKSSSSSDGDKSDAKKSDSGSSDSSSKSDSAASTSSTPAPAAKDYSAVPAPAFSSVRSR